MKFNAEQIANMLGGTVEGNKQAEVWTLCKIEEGEPGGLSFLANPKYTHYIYNTQASVVIVRTDFQPEQPVSATMIRVADPYMAFAMLLKKYNEIQLDKRGINSMACIAPSAKLGENCYVGPLAVIGENVKIGNNVKIYPHTYVGDNSVIGDNTTLFSGVRIYQHIVIGARCILHSGAVIGADGFGFAPTADGSYEWNGTTYTESGNYSWTGSTEQGCDSVVTLILTINPLGIEGEGMDVSVSIYPNPTRGMVNIEADGIEKVEVYDLNGRKLESYDATNRINLQGMAAGTYMLRVYTTRGTVVKRVILK
jgi:UDP-3-O-[3-hydroxymyristoyl] glucosamine N-acyltransferase